MHLSRWLVRAAVLAALGLPTAQAACVITTGSGTLVNLGPGTRVDCTGTTTFQNIRWDSAQSTVVFGPNSVSGPMQIEAGPNATGARVSFSEGSSGNSLNVILNGASTLLEINGAWLQDSINLAVTGNNSTVTVTGGSLVSSSSGSGIALLGDDSVLNLDEGSVIEHAGSATGVRGWTGRQVFNLYGTVRSLGGGISVDAAEGDDQINISATTQIDSLVVGGDGDDLLTSSGGFHSFSTEEIERHEVLAGADVVMVGSHQFTRVDLDGRLRVGTSGSIGDDGVVVDLGDTGRLEFINSDLQIMNFVLTGTGNATTGGLVLAGNGTIVLSSASSFTGGTRINQGLIVLNDGQALGTGVVVNNGGLRLGNVTFNNVVTGTGYIEKTASGTTTIGGNNSHTGGVFVRSGTVRARAAALGSGTLVFDAGTTFQLLSGFQTISNVNANSNSLFEMLGGHTFLTGGSFGNLRLNAGRASVNGTIGVTGSNGFVIDAGAVLEGRGTINGNLFNGGTVAPGEISLQLSGSLDGSQKASGPRISRAPGDLINTLTVNGNYTQDADGVLEIEFDGSGNIDLLDVTGTATLDGTLRLISVGGAEGQGGTFLSAAGGVSGTFATVETIGAQLPLAVVYTANNVLQAPSVLSARPSTFNSQSLAIADAGFAFLDTVADRVDHARGDSAGWMQLFGAAGQRDARDASLGYSHDMLGAVVGYDWALGRDWRVGVAVGGGESDVTIDEAAGSGRIDHLLGSLYAARRFGAVDVSGGLLVGRASQETRRVVSFSGLTQTVPGSTDTASRSLFVAAGLELGERNGWQARLDGRAAWLNQTQDAFVEDGTSVLRLAVGELDGEHAELSAGVSLMRPVALGNGGRLTPFARLGARYLASLDDREIPVSFALSGAGVTLEGDRRDFVQGYGTLGLLWEPSSRVGVQFSYRGQVADAADNHELRAGISVSL